MVTALPLLPTPLRAAGIPVDTAAAAAIAAAPGRAAAAALTHADPAMSAATEAEDTGAAEAAAICSLGERWLNRGTGGGTGAAAGGPPTCSPR